MRCSLLVILIVAVAALEAVTPNQNDLDLYRYGKQPDCSDGKTVSLPNPDPTKYYQCSSGHTFVQSCAPGTVWNQQSGACATPRLQGYIPPRWDPPPPPRS